MRTPILPLAALLVTGSVGFAQIGPPVAKTGGNVGNKGSECAEAALQMIGLLKNLP